MSMSRLKWIADLVKDPGENGLKPLISLENIESGTGRLLPGSPIPEIESPRAGVASVLPGDVLFGKLRPYLAKSWLVDKPCFASTELLGLRPRETTDSRWLAYVLASTPLIDWAIASSDGSKMPRTSWEKLGEYELSVPSLESQRELANHLDHDTARIDALLEAKRRMVRLTEEHLSVAFDRAIGDYGFDLPLVLDPDWSQEPLPEGWSIMRLSQALLQLTNGFVGPTRDILRDEGIPYVQSLHIKHGKIDFGRRPFYVGPEWHNARPRIHLREGDVLIVQTGDIGQVAVVPPDFGEASCHALQIARVNPRFLSGTYLAAYLRSSFGRQSLLSRATGALHPHLEAGVKDVPIVVPSHDVQNRIVEVVNDSERQATRLIGILNKQMSLLAEHRQALITETVTGRLEIAVAA